MPKARPVKHVSPSQAVADIIRTTLGPRSMLKMLLDASGGARGAVSAASSASAGRQQTFAMTAQRGSSPTEAVQHMAISSKLGPVAPPTNLLNSLACAGIVITNDGNAILREIDVSHPAAKVNPTL